jgi:hypothetical protein
MTLAEFKAKWGIKTPNLIIGEFIARAPEFPGDEALAETIGELLGDLESMLNQPPQ